MEESLKRLVLGKVRNHISHVRKAVASMLADTTSSLIGIQKTISKSSPADQFMQLEMMKLYERRVRELDQLHTSPYFVRCKVRFDDEKEIRQLFFSRFAFTEELIYSWTAAAAVIRFESPGRFSYKSESGIKGGELLEKDQFLIADGQILFMAAEAKGMPRELMYQAYFSQHKTSFALPEIVEQMEKAQDKVIRAPYKGSFLISGPAGSGKTTLALHRVAYLAQSPDTSEKFDAGKVIVFVQDVSTKDYFSKLLPELGVKEVVITTFADWALQRLQLEGIRYGTRLGRAQAEQDMFEYIKYLASKNISNITYSKNVFSMLDKVYVPLFSPQLRKIWKQQRSERLLDKFDLAILLRLFIESRGELTEEQISYKQLRAGKVRIVRKQLPLQYSLIILDEVQNYLPEQIQMLKPYVSKETNSLLYVGDLAQQTQLCTLKSWADIGEEFSEDRKVVLQKNYRSTRQILEYINRLGYNVPIPSYVKQGPAVVEHICSSLEERIQYIKTVIQQKKQEVVGILCKTHDELVYFKEALTDYPHVHIMTINEAQGVEFDTLFLIGADGQFFAVEPVQYGNNEQLLAERRRVDKDLLYVALTRAMNELHVLSALSRIINTP